ncbi:MAG: hypothetical protein V1717_01385 [Candidatus Micrarchaeota archaeon]
MRKQAAGLLNAQKKILSERKYLMLFLAATAAFAWVFVSLTSIPGQGWGSWLYSVTDYTKLFILIGAPLLGLILTTQAYVLSNYRFGMHEAKAGTSALGAFAAGVIATACCSPLTGALLASSGFIGASFFLQQYSPQVFAIAILVLAFSLYYSSKIIFCEECGIKTMK